MPKSDLWRALDCVFTKKPLSGSPPSIFILHRFLASDPDFAIVARYFQKEIRNPEMVFRAWQGIAPTNPRGSPRLKYVGAKKQPAAEALVQAVMQHLAERREVVENMLELASQLGVLDALYQHHGIEQETA